MGLKRTMPDQFLEPEPSPRTAPVRLADAGREQSRAALEHQLMNGGVPQRRWAARDLAAFPESAACLGEHLLREPVARVSEAIFTTLKTHANEAALQALLPLLRSEDAMLRNGAIEALSGMPALVAPHIRALLQDADPDVRIFTVNLLADLRHADVPLWLRSVIDNDPHVNVVAAAIEVLAETGNRADHQALRRARDRFADEPFIGFAVDMAMQRTVAA